MRQLIALLSLTLISCESAELPKERVHNSRRFSIVNMRGEIISRVSAERIALTSEGCWSIYGVAEGWTQILATGCYPLTVIDEVR